MPMSSISSISGNNNNYLYGQFATGKKLNKASDGAAEMAISQKMTAQINSYKAYSNNVASAKDMYAVKDAATSSIVDSQNRVNTLNIKSMNELYSDSDIDAINNEIDQLNAGIDQTVETTTFNGQQVFDGTPTSSSRASDGATVNGLEHAYNVYQSSALNTTAALSNLEDLDYAEASSEVKKTQILNDYATQMQKKMMEDQEKQNSQFFALS